MIVPAGEQVDCQESESPVQVLEHTGMEMPLGLVQLLPAQPVGKDIFDATDVADLRVSILNLCQPVVEPLEI